MAKEEDRRIYDMYHEESTKEEAILRAWMKSCPVIRAIVKSLWNDVKTDDLEDIEHSMYEPIIGILDKYDPKRGNWKRWLECNAHSTILDLVNKARTNASYYMTDRHGLKRLVSLNVQVPGTAKAMERQDMIPAKVDIEGSFVKKDEQEELMGIVREAIERNLEGSEREIMGYRFTGGYGAYRSVKETAEAFGIAPRTVAAITHRAKKKLEKDEALQELYREKSGQDPDKEKGKSIDRTGERHPGKDGGWIVITAYRGVKDMDAIWRIDNIYYFFPNAQFQQLSRHLSHACMMKHMHRIEADTFVHGKMAAAYF